MKTVKNKKENDISYEEQEDCMVYYCTKCKRNHNGNSGIGREHKIYSAGVVNKKKPNWKKLNKNVWLYRRSP